MKISIAIQPSLVQKEQILQLWNAAYSKAIHLENIHALDNYLDGLTEAVHYFLTDEASEICGWASVFLRDDEKWFAIIIDEKTQGNGAGTMLLNELKHIENALSGWVIDKSGDIKQDGNAYQSPLQFYLKNEFVINPEIRLETEKIAAVKISWKPSSVL